MHTKFFYLSFLLILYTGFLFPQNKWKNIGAPSGGNVMSISEQTNKYLYAGTEYSGIFRSEDNGDTWQSISTGIEEYNNGIRSVLATKNHVFCGTYGALYRSTNDGDKWEKITETFDNSWVFDLESVGKNIFAATSKGLYKSSDNGITWNLADTSLPENEMLAIGKRDSILIVVYNSSDGIGISTDNGKNWEQKSFWVGTAFDILISKNYNIYAATVEGVYRSTDLGENWIDISPFDQTITSIIEDSSGSIYCAQSEKVYKLNPDKVSWSDFNNGLSNNYPRTLFYSSNHKLFLGTLENGVFYYNFNQNLWIQTKFPASLVYKLEMYKDNFYVCSTQKDIFLSSDKGESWDKKLSIENGCVSIYDKNTIIAGDGNYNENRRGVLISYDKGNSWEMFNDGFALYEWTPGNFIYPTVYQIEILNYNEVYALTQNGFYQGNLNTKSWNLVVAYQFHGGSDILKLSDNNFLIADVVLNTIIDGNIKVLYVPANFFVEDNNNIFFAGNNFRYIGRNGIFWGEVYKLTDNESNYELLLKLPDTISINDMKIDKLDRIYLATTQGLYISSNKGVEWNKIDNEFSNETITSLQVGYDNRLFAITNMGIFKEIEYDTVNTINDEINSFALFQNFPNPFNSSTTIRYQIQQAGIVSLKVYDVLGKEVASLVNEEKPAGEYNVTFNGSNLSSGVYFYQLKSGSFVETKKLIVVK